MNKVWGLWVDEIELLPEAFTITGRAAKTGEPHVETVGYEIPHPDLAEMVRSRRPVVAVTHPVTGRIASLRA